MANLCTVEVIERLFEVYSVKNMKELSIAITGKPTAVANWKSRDAIPSEILFEVAEKKGVSLDWLAYGKQAKELDELQSMLLNAFNSLSQEMKRKILALVLTGGDSGHSGNTMNVNNTQADNISNGPMVIGGK